MQVIDIHAHVYPKVAGITQGQPMTSMHNGKVMIGNTEKQFLPPSFVNCNSTTDVLIDYMNWRGIEKALLMPNPYYGYFNHYFKQSAAEYPDRLKGVALVNFLDGQKAADELAAIYDEKSLMGFKIETDSTFQCRPSGRMTDSEFAPVWDCCNQYHQPVFIHPFRNCDVEDLMKLPVMYPKINFVICHMGADACFGKGVREENFRDVMQIVKKNSNVYIDTSTVPDFFQDNYPWPSAVEVIETCCNIVGAEKIMWASDYPGMLRHGTLKQLIDMVAVECRNIREEDKKLILSENARRLFFAD